MQGYVSYDTRLFGLNIHASSLRTFGNYNDLASATARMQSFTTASSSYLDGPVAFLP